MVILDHLCVFSSKNKNGDCRVAVGSKLCSSDDINLTKNRSCNAHECNDLDWLQIGNV